MQHSSPLDQRRYAYGAGYADLVEQRRPKSDYGRALAEKRVGHKATSGAQAKGPKYRVQQGCPTPSPQRRHDFAEFQADATMHSTFLCSTTPGHPLPVAQKEALKHNSPKVPHVELSINDSMPQDSLDSGAAALLTQLQQAVMSVSHEMMQEHLRSTQQQKRIEALEYVISQQNAMLGELRRQYDTAQQDKMQLMKTYQGELRRGGVEAAVAPPSAYLQALPSAALSTADVDRHIVSEFRRFASSSSSFFIDPFDELNPVVVAVLRSLATQVLQPSSAARQTAQGRPSRVHGVQSILSPSPSSGTPSAVAETGAPTTAVISRWAEQQQSSLENANGGATIRAVASSPLYIGESSPCQPSSTSLLRTPAVAALPETQHAGGSGGEFPNESAKSAVEVAAVRKPRTSSEVSASTASSIYEDAASILSDIRSRYGL